MDWFLLALKKYAVFSGRARRKEFWFFTLIYSILALVFYIPGIAFIKSNPVLGLAFIAIELLIVLAFAIPSLAVAVRRLHDTGKSGWLVLINIVPIIGAIVLLVFYCSNSQPGENQYGPNPKKLEPSTSIL